MLFFLVNPGELKRLFLLLSLWIVCTSIPRKSDSHKFIFSISTTRDIVMWWYYDYITNGLWGAAATGIIYERWWRWTKSDQSSSLEHTCSYDLWTVHTSILRICTWVIREQYVPAYWGSVPWWSVYYWHTIRTTQIQRPQTSI